MACRNAHSTVVILLLAVDDIAVNQAMNDKATPLCVACQEGHLKVVRLLLAFDGTQAIQADDFGITPLMRAVNNGHTAIVVLCLQVVIGHNNIDEWFSVDSVPRTTGRIALYKYAVLLPQQHQPLLNFHLCLLSTQNAIVPISSLKAFNRTWPQTVAFKIESFLLPTKQTRWTLQR